MKHNSGATRRGNREALLPIKARSALVRRSSRDAERMLMESAKQFNRLSRLFDFLRGPFIARAFARSGNLSRSSIRSQSVLQLRTTHHFHRNHVQPHLDEIQAESAESA